jgi:hypothetical protein
MDILANARFGVLDKINAYFFHFPSHHWNFKLSYDPLPPSLKRFLNNLYYSPILWADMFLNWMNLG